MFQVHNIVAGNLLNFKNGTHFFQGIVTNVATNVITVDSPFDYAFSATSTVERCNINMNVNGSVTPVIFNITPSGLTNVKLDITKIHFYISDGTAMTSELFGGLTALTRGVVVRSIDGVHKVHFNIKKNGEFGLHCDDVRYDDRASGSNIWSVSAIKRFAGQENQGVTIRLESMTDDTIQIIVQDDLTGLIQF